MHQCLTKLQMNSSKVATDMFSLEGYIAIELSPRIVPRIMRVDGSIEEGNLDPYGRPWVMWEGRFPPDNSLFTIYASTGMAFDARRKSTAGEKEPANYDSPLGQEQERMTSHNGSHIQGGKGHISHWKGAPADMKGLWELNLETFLGDAAVCNLSNLEPQAVTNESNYPKEYPKPKFWLPEAEPGELRGQEILPEHLNNVNKGDIVLMTSPFAGLGQPWLSTKTVEWLIEDRKIKMLGLGHPGIEWQYDLKVAAPDNSPVKRMLLGANIPIVHPLVNIETISSDRVFYYGMPLNVGKLEASFVRAVAFEERG